MTVPKRDKRIAPGLIVAALIAVVVLFAGDPETDAGSRPREKATADRTRAPAPSRVRSTGTQVDGDMRASVEVLVRGLALGETAPLPGAEVLLRRSEEQPDGASDPAPEAAIGRESLEATVDRTGCARFDSVRPGRWDVQARAPGYLSARGAFEVRAVGGAPHRWELNLEAHAAIDLTVIGPAGGAVEGATARVVLATDHPESRRRLHPKDRKLGAAGAWTTGPDGRVTLGVVPVQEPFLFVVDHAERGRFSVRFESLQAGETRPLRAVLAAHTVLVGAVPRAPAPGARVAVECWHIGENARGLVAEHKTPVTPDRRFRLTRLAAGRKRLVYTATTETSVEVGTLDVEAPPGVETDVGEIPTENSTVRVLVLTDEDVQPLEKEVNLSVIWLPADLAVPSMPVAVRVRPGREVLLRGFAAGQLLLSAKMLASGSRLSDPDYEGARTRISFDGADASVELVLGREQRSAQGEIRVRVAPPPGVEADRVAARVYVLSDGAVVGQVSRAVDGSLSFGFQRFRPGRYQVLGVANGFRSVPLSVDVEPDRVNSVLLERWVRAVPLEGRVIRDGLGVEAARVQLSTTRGGPEGTPPPLLEVLTDPTGAFRFEALPQVAELELRAFSAGGGSAPLGVAADGSSTHAVLELELEDAR